MAFEPDYGETLLTEEERDALTAEAREVLGEPIRKADLYDLEQQIQDEVADGLVAEVVDGALTPSELLTDHFVRALHQRLYRPVWEWGGHQRSRETNIGIGTHHRDPRGRDGRLVRPCLREAAARNELNRGPAAAR